MAKVDVLAEYPVGDGGMPQAMEPAQEEPAYRIWACDNQVYGPIPASILQQWAQETRVQRHTWVYLEDKAEWRQAANLEELRHCFSPGEETLFLQRQAASATGIDVHELRLFPIFSNLPTHELAQFIRFAELVIVQPGEIVMKRREPGDAIFFVLSGTVRAQIRVGGEEKVLAKIGPGEFFGEMAMLTQTPRSADVVVEEACRLLRFSAGAFRLLIEESPAAAAPMLYSLSSLMARRVLEVNNRFQHEVASGFVWR